MFDVVCIGQAVIDCIVRGKESEPYKPGVYRAGTIRLHTGGDAVNESTTLAAMGYRAAIVCGLGEDMAGNILADSLEKAGVDTCGIRRIATDTPIANLQVAEDGSRFSVNAEAIRLPGYRILPEEVPAARIYSFASLFRPPLSDSTTIRAIMEKAKMEGTRICCDTKLPLSPDIRIASYRDILPMIDYLFPNEKEAAWMTGESTLPGMARALRGMGVRHVIIKAGAEGCYVCAPEDEFSLPAEPVDEVVDTTGAGDHFVAGYLSGLLRNRTVRECAALGIHSAAQAITHTGG